MSDNGSVPAPTPSPQQILPPAMKKYRVALHVKNKSVNFFMSCLNDASASATATAIMILSLPRVSGFELYEDGKEIPVAVVTPFGIAQAIGPQINDIFGPGPGSPLVTPFVRRPTPGEVNIFRKGGK